MAYETGTATNMADLLSKLNTFATANGWTVDEFDTGGGDWALSKGTVFVSARWDVSSPNHLALYQALGFISTATLPGNHTDDSGNGYNATSSHTNTLLDDERHVTALGNGPFLSYHFFEQDSGPAYLHVVVEKSIGLYRHFGFGTIEKVGTWTGGEYCYGHFADTGASHTPIQVNESLLLDGLYRAAGAPQAATLHCEGLPNQPGSGKWGVCAGLIVTDSKGTDTAAVAREFIRGGFRSGPVAVGFGPFNGSSLTGLIPAYPIALFHRDSVSTTRARLLGYMPDVRGINIRNFAVAEEVTIGADTWVVFPNTLRSIGAVNERSYYAGIAYKKVTA